MLILALNFLDLIFVDWDKGVVALKCTLEGKK